MKDAATDLRSTLAAVLPRLRAIDEARASLPRGEGKWSPKEILGHLIDSAANNHQRFVRAQMAREIVLPGYEQERWVEGQGYQERPWSDIVVLWQALNLHLAHILERLPASARTTICRIGANPPLDLEVIVRDYLAHLRNHLNQVLEDRFH